MKGKLKTDPRPGWGWTGVLAPLLVAAGIGLAPLVALAQQQTSVPTLRPGDGRDAETASLSPLPVGGPGPAVLPQPLGLADADRYRQIFDLQDDGRFREAEVVLG